MICQNARECSKKNACNHGEEHIPDSWCELPCLSIAGFRGSTCVNETPYLLPKGLTLEWEEIKQNCADTLQRARVPGGWLVKSTCEVQTRLHPDMDMNTGFEWRTSLCYVPDHNHKWGVV
jgi:hypothetical protein